MIVIKNNNNVVVDYTDDKFDFSRTTIYNVESRTKNALHLSSRIFQVESKLKLSIKHKRKQNMNIDYEFCMLTVTTVFFFKLFMAYQNKFKRSWTNLYIYRWPL